MITMTITIKGVKSNLAKGHIADFSPPQLQMDSSDLDTHMIRFLKTTRITPPQWPLNRFSNFWIL